MSGKKITHKEAAQYLDIKVPLQQLEQLPDIDLSSLELLDLHLEPFPKVDLSDVTDVLRGLEDE